MKKNNLVIPIITYHNAEIDKYNIYIDNKGKCGIYRFSKR